jgi:hypothetical protein
LAHCDTYLLSVAPSRFVASATTIGGVAIHENPEPSMGAGKVLPPARVAGAVMAWIARSTTALPSAGCSAVSPAARSRWRVVVGVIPELH